MVKLDKIYTKGGDDGETSLVGGERVPKHSLRPSAFGAVDEVNSLIGICRLHTRHLTEQKYDEMLGRIQNDLFDLGADLATPPRANRQQQDLRITSDYVNRIEKEIDSMNADLPPLDSFILPGGETAGAFLHLARTHARRAERAMTELATAEKIGKPALQYINRLSDFLFVMTRCINTNENILWKAGMNASSDIKKE